MIIEKAYLYKVEFIEVDSWETLLMYISANDFDEAYDIANKTLNKEYEIISNIKMVRHKKKTYSVFTRDKE